MFNVKQLRQLKARLKPDHVRERYEDGFTLHYLEGWHVIAEANRIFGFDGWNRETVDSSCVYTKRNGDRYEAVYVARVRIIVEADGRRIVREGSGTGEANTASPGQAHEFALKAAETDATKRALMTFGNAFGLSLYAGSARTSPVNSPVQQPDLRQSKRTRLSTELKEREHSDRDDRVRGAESDGHDADKRSRRSAEARIDDLPSDQTKVDEMSALASSMPDLIPTGEEQEPAPRPNGHDVSQTGTQPIQARIDKSALALSEPKRLRDPEHLKFVAHQPCLICGRNRSQAHHLTFAQPHALGRKVSDEFTVPLCSTHHQELHHAGNEQAWWEEKGIEPVSFAKELWARQ